MSGAHPDPSYLHQNVLVILRFPPEGVADALSADDESYIDSQLSTVSDFIWTGSNQSLLVTFEFIKVLQSMTASDYEGYPFTDSTGQTHTEYAGKYSDAANQSLARRLVDPRQYAGVIMIYYPSNQPGQLFENTWEYFNDQLGGAPLNPGFSGIVYQGTDIPLWQVITHEYCHQLHHRFMLEAKDLVPVVDQVLGSSFGFIDSDSMTLPGTTTLSLTAQYLGALTGTTFQPGQDAPWLQAILKDYVGPSDIQNPNGTLHTVNYRWLEGRRPDDVVLGVFNGGELKEKYDFSQPDDVLVYVRGDNITQLNPTGSPGTFWFRAQPGGAAAFGTQTGFSRYLVQQVAFQYEIAPDDYSFQVHLVYYDDYGNLVDQRIDDGVYVLGRQKFAHNHKVIDLRVPQEVEDFRIVFQKGNQLSGAAASDDW
ncbi:MAG TPA: hypothetical protein VE779_01380, partial [Candidatus Angelobacter sp.]|nr:hypothetical protein [Candidatus Angelobacter sp.]